MGLEFESEAIPFTSPDHPYNRAQRDESLLRTSAQTLFDELVGELARAQSLLSDAGTGPLDTVGNRFFGTDQAWFDQQRGVLNAAGVQLARMEPTSPGELAKALFAGELSWERFRAIGQQVRDNVSAVLAELGSTYSAGRIWDEIVAPTGASLADGVERTVARVSELTPWVAAAAVALAVAYVVFAFRR